MREVPRRKRRPILLATGLVALDVVIGSDGSEPPQIWAGGTCGNLVAILGDRGWDAYPIARMGCDSSSRHVTLDLQRCHVRLNYIDYESELRTPVVIERIRNDKHGRPYHRFSFTCPSCGAWLPSYRPIRLSRATSLASIAPPPDVFFFDRVSPGAIHLANEFAGKGSLVFFEPSGIGDPRLFRKAMAVAHVVKYSSERVGEMAEFRSKVDPILEIETLGEEGLRFRLRNNQVIQRWSHLNSLRGGVVKDTAGAGDWCTAGLILRLGTCPRRKLLDMASGEVSEALRYGQALAAWACRFEGPRAGMYRQRPAVIERSVQRILSGSPPQADPEIAAEKARETLRFLCLECATKSKDEVATVASPTFGSSLPGLLAG